MIKDNKLNSRMKPREERIAVAKNTIEISNQGWYELQSYKVKLDERLSTYRIPTETLTNKVYPVGTNTPIYEVLPKTTGDTIFSLGKNKDRQPIGVLNFASAKNRGGGFLKGSLAQEEALCYCSNLYKSQLQQDNYYDTNKHAQNGLYTDEMFASEYVTFFKSDKYELQLKPVTVDIVITAPAVNRTNLKNVKKEVADEKMLERVRWVIKAFIEAKVEILVLGAWGCGVFGNEPDKVAEHFKKVLVEEKLGTHFKRIIFAVPKGRDNNFEAFNNVWNK